MSYFATDWTRLSPGTDLQAPAAPGLPQDVRVLGQTSQSHRQFVWISWAYMRPGPDRWCVRARLDFLHRTKRTAGLSRSTVWEQRQTGKWTDLLILIFWNFELMHFCQIERNKLNSVNLITAYAIVRQYLNTKIFILDPKQAAYQKVLCFLSQISPTISYGAEWLKVTSFRVAVCRLLQ